MTNSVEKLIPGIPPEKGNYFLIFQIRDSTRILVGSLGLQIFPAGEYAYTGSALGPGGIRARVKHHLNLSPKPHWHMDYLKPSVQWLMVGWIVTQRRLECDWAQKLLQAGGTTPANGFGASDCQQGCGAHLIRLHSTIRVTLGILQPEGYVDIMYNKANF